MKSHFALSELSRPFASNDHSILDLPHTIFRTAKIRGKTTWTEIDNKLMNDPGLTSHLKGVLCDLLKYRDDYEFEHMADSVMRDDNVSRNTAYELINQLVDLGYVHKVVYMGGNFRPVKRYKVTELPLRPQEDARKFTWVGGTQTSRARATGAFQNLRTVGNFKVTLTAEIDQATMLAERNALYADMAELRREQAIENYREARANDFLAPAKRLPKFWDPNKRRNRSAPIGAEKESQTLSPKGPQEDFLNPEESLPSAFPFESSESSKSGRPLAGAARAQRRSTRRQALQRKRSAAGQQRKARNPRQAPQDFDALPEAVRMSPGDDALRAFAKDYANLADAAMREFVGPKDEGWRERLVANPYMGMLQRVLGVPVWTASELRLWRNRMRRGTLRFDELLLLWSALIAGKEAMHPQLHREILNRLDMRRFRDVAIMLPPDVGFDEGIPRNWNWIMNLIRVGMTRCISSASAEPETVADVCPALSTIPREVFASIVVSQGLDYSRNETYSDYETVKALEGYLSAASAHPHQRMLLTTETAMYLLLPEMFAAEGLVCDPDEVGVTEILAELAPPRPPAADKELVTSSCCVDAWCDFINQS